jgi:hypothetical protein
VNPSPCTQAAQIAFSAAYQWWLAQDAHLLAELEGRPDRLDCDWVEEIQGPYGLGRTLGGDRPQWVVNTLRQVGNLPMQERADKLEGLANARRDKEPGWKRPMSALSKISWFLHPDGWTMFDSYACRAVGAVGFGDYYCKLINRGWDNILAAVRLALPDGIDRRLAERTLDAFLMLVADDKRLHRRLGAIRNFENALPADISEKLRASGADVAKILQRGELLAPEFKNGLN